MPKMLINAQKEQIVTVEVWLNVVVTTKLNQLIKTVILTSNIGLEDRKFNQRRLAGNNQPLTP